MPLSRIQLAKAFLIGALGYPLIALLGLTLRWIVDGAHYHDAIVRSGRQPILSLWHGRILAGTLYWKGHGFVVITSENFDGEWIARIIERFGYGTARGSTSRGGRKAILQMIRDMKAGRPAGFTLDGPRGPARVAQGGAVWLASATGNPVLPFHLEASSNWSLRSWDRTQIPKPFSTVALAVGEPMEVPGDASGEVLEQSRQELERRLGALEARAAQMLERPNDSNARTIGTS
jgi:lysophospholipid acyltransferase (LPLAT)-like uncharacterized protein